MVEFRLCQLKHVMMRKPKGISLHRLVQYFIGYSLELGKRSVKDDWIASNVKNFNFIQDGDVMLHFANLGQSRLNGNL